MYQHLMKSGPQFLSGETLFLQTESKYLQFESSDRDGHKYLIELKPIKMIEPAQHSNVEELKNIFNNIVKRVKEEFSELIFG
jgi:hypothetical protein